MTLDLTPSKWQEDATVGIADGPVTRGLVGQFEIRSLVGYNDFDPVSTIPDLSGNGNDMLIADTHPHLYLGGDFPRLIPNPADQNFEIGMYAAAHDFAPDTATEWSVCGVASVPFFHNSFAPYTFGLAGGDYYSGPLFGGWRAPSGPFVQEPVGNPIAAGEALMAGLASKLGGTTTLCQDGIIFEVPNIIGAMSYPQIELSRGNSFATIWAALFYTVQLTHDELKQNAIYLRGICGLGL